MEPKFYYRKFSALLVCLAIYSGIHAQQIAKSLTASTGLFIGFYEYKPTNYNADPTKKYPLIIFLHGIGERGNGTTELPRVLVNGIPKYINAGHNMTFTSLSGQQETFLVLSPQLADNQVWQNIYIDEMLKYAKANLRVDTNRIYLTGLSLGGGGTWRYLTSSLNNSKQFAATAIVCGTCDWGNLCSTVVPANLPIWAFHAQDDHTVNVSCTNNAIATINACNPVVKPIKTIYATGDHWIWDQAYDTVHNFHNPNVFEWFLGNAKNLAPNTLPVANAGPDRIITLPLNSVQLNGGSSTDADGTIARSYWTMIQSPGGGWLESPNASVCNAYYLNQGVYKFELTVVDNRAGTSKDTVMVTVNPTSANIPPFARAGNDTLVSNANIPLNASSSYDIDGFIQGYNWRQVSGPGAINVSCATCATPVVSNLINNGTYAVELEVIDNLGARTKDTVYITENYAVAPVDFLYFKGKNTGRHNILQWATANEFNNRGFEVQRSVDGKNYTALGFVQAGASKQNEYSFTDENAPQQLSYYRLMQVDSKQQTYSRVVTVNNTNANISLEYYPNPVESKLLVQLQSSDKGMLRIKLLNVDGKLVGEKQFVKSQELFSGNMDFEKLRSGIYFIEMEIGTTREVRMVVKK